MEWENLLMFSGLMALGQMTPGPDWILVTRHSLAGGKRAGILTALGITCGLAIHSSLALFGLTRSLATSERLKFALELIFAGYLVMIAAGILRSHSRCAPEQSAGKPVARPFLKGFFCNLLNGKVLIFFAAIFAAFLKANTSAVWLVSLWSVAVVQSGLLWILWAILLQAPAVASRWQKWQRPVEYSFAVVLIGIAIYLLLA